MEHLMRFRSSYMFIWKILKRKPFKICTSSNLLYSTSINPIGLKHIVISDLQTNHVRYAKKALGKMSKGGKPKIVPLTDDEMNEVIDLNDYRNQLHQLKEKLRKDFIENLSLRSSGNIENIMVKVEGDEYPLQELAQISRKNQNLIALNMADFPEALKPAIQAIIESGSNLNPQQDGTMIYLTVPKLTREHRENLAKNAKTLFGKAKEEARNIQNFFVRDAKRKTDLPEDLVFNASQQIMKIAEETVTEMEKLLKTKQKELLGET